MEISKIKPFEFDQITLVGNVVLAEPVLNVQYKKDVQDFLLYKVLNVGLGLKNDEQLGEIIKVGSIVQKRWSPPMNETVEQNNIRLNSCVLPILKEEEFPRTSIINVSQIVSIYDAVAPERMDAFIDMAREAILESMKNRDANLQKGQNQSKDLRESFDGESESTTFGPTLGKA